VGVVSVWPPERGTVVGSTTNTPDDLLLPGGVGVGDLEVRRSTGQCQTVRSRVRSLTLYEI